MRAVAYLWAALRTVAILAAICISLFSLVLLLAGIVAAFTWSVPGGCLVLALVFGICALFGIQLTRVAKIERTKLIGNCLRFGFGFAAALSLLLSALIPYEFYLWTYSDPVFKHLGLNSPRTIWSPEGVFAFVFMDIANVIGVVLPVAILGAIVIDTWRGMRRNS
jgi:hypothetical protein